jgi:hypothetical protein
MMTVFVLNLHYRGPKKNEIPFWLQQLLSLSMANIVRTFRSTKNMSTCRKNLLVKQTKKADVYELNRVRTKTNVSSSINGIPSTYTNLDEATNFTRLTTDVSQQERCVQIYLCVRFNRADKFNANRNERHRR